MSATRPDKISLAVYSGDFDKVHYALVMASGAAAIGTAATLFFTGDALKALTPGWRAMPIGRGGDMGLSDAGSMDDDFKAKRIGTFEELLSACTALGVKIMVCEMGLRALGMKRGDLRADIQIEEGGIVTFLEGASKTGAVVFI